MRSTHRLLPLAGLTLALLPACRDNDDDDVFMVNQPAEVSAAGVTDARESPAQVSFMVSDEEDDPAEVQLVYFLQGSATPMPLTLVGNPDLSSLRATQAGTMHTFQWDFATDVGTGFTPGVQVRVDAVDAVQSIVSSATVANVGLGNDPPAIVPPAALAGGTGEIPVPLQVSDSTDDVVEIVIEYDVVGDMPDAGFRLARPANIPAALPTPAVAYTVNMPSAGGLDLQFDWDSAFDEPGRDFEAILRFSPSDDLVPGPSEVTNPILIDNNASAAALAITVTDGRESPATVTFDLADPEADTQRVELFFVRPGSAVREPMTLAIPDPLDGLAADPGGTTHVRLWDFATDLGSTAFVQGFGASLDVLEAAVVSTVDAPPFAIGNDAPQVTNLVSAPMGEVTGDVDVTVRVADSTDDLVSIAVEYDVLGDSPDAGFRLARPAGLAPGDPTPAFAVTGLVADQGGVDVPFAWDAVFDEGATDFEAVLRFTPEDDLVAGAPFSSGPLALDNNEEPRGEVEENVLGLNTDRTRGVPIPFTVFDAEGDAITVLVQWRLENTMFPALPADAAALRGALGDPAQRRALQIATEYPAGSTGRTRTLAAAMDPNGDRLRLPELATTAAAVHATGPEGFELELRRIGSAPAATGHPWTLAGPVDVLPLGRGITALVLDSPASRAWRLREMDLATGAEVRSIASGTEGDPFAMASRGAGEVVIAAGDGALWTLLGVELGGGVVTELVPATSTPVGGVVRGLALADADRAVITAGTSLVLAHLDGSGATVLADDFTTPWGVATDRRALERAFVADRGDPSDPGSTGGVFEVDLATAGKVLLAGGLARPRALAVAPDGSRLHAVVDGDPGDGLFELAGVDLGGTAPGGAFELAGGFTDDSGGLAAGPDGLVALALRVDGDLAVGGGIEQARTVAAYDASTQTVTVDTPFDPAARSGAAWYLREPLAAKVASQSGSAGTFLWDSRDVAQGADVVFRVVGIDTDVGASGMETLTPRTVDAPLDVEPWTLGSGATSDPVALASADFDQDGNPDVVSANAGGEDLTVFLQTSPGSFEAGPVLDMGAGSQPGSVVAADFDGDGLADVVGADGAPAGGGARLFVQTAPGTFATGTAIGAGQVNALAAGDLDRDGALDLVVASPTAVGIHFGGPGGPGATPDQELTGLSDPRALAIADLGGDGALDLLVGEAGTGDVSVFEGPSFSAAALSVAAPMAGGEARTIAATDVDGDGRRDVVVGYAGIDVLAWFAQDAVGGFVAPVVLGDPSTTAAPGRVSVLDLDRDGDGDLVAAVASGKGLAVFFQTAPGAFATAPDLDLGVTGSVSGARDVVAADFDGDGSVDLFAANGAANELSLLTQKRAGDFRSTSTVLSDPGTPEDAVLVEPGDFDGDGDLDLALANRVFDHITVYLQTAPGVFDPDPNGPIGVGRLSGVTGLAAGDVDGDGDVDLVAAVTGGSQIAVMLQNGGALSVTALLGSIKTTYRPRSVALGDLDGDGDVDIVSCNTGDLDLTAFLQSAPGVFPQSPSFRIGGGLTIEPNTVMVRDLDGDGDVDIASANTGNPTTGLLSGVTTFLNTATGFAKKPSQGLLTGLPGSGVRDAAVGDLDGDGDLDFVVADQDAGALVVFDQTSPGSFARGITLDFRGGAIAPSWVEVADVDGDGDDDVAALDDASGRVLVFLQGAPGRFHGELLADLATLAPGGVSVALRLADLDGDGDSDVVTADSIGGVQTVHFGGR